MLALFLARISVAHTVVQQVDLLNILHTVFETQLIVMPASP